MKKKISKKDKLKALSAQAETVAKAGKKRMKSSDEGIDVSSREVEASNPYAKLPKLPMLHQNENSIDDVTLDEFTRGALTKYGSYVVEERAIADYRDGLKPVHRALLWSLAGLGLRPHAGYKKSARTVGDTIGKYHPHGDAAAYGAMVTIANTMPPVVDGQGNWGTPVDPAAAHRYTEARMSKFAHLFMVDSKYLEVVPKVPNFSDDEVIPLFMPALLPYLLFNGSIPAPAYGVRAGNPSFSFQSVAKVVSDMLRGEEYDSKRLAKTLKIQHAFGCDDVTERKEFQSMLATGKGNITYTAKFDFDFKRKIIHIRSFVPAGFASRAAIDKALAKISAIKGVKAAYSSQGKRSKGSGPYGALCIIETLKNLNEDAFDDICSQVEDICTNSVNYRLGVTIRKADESNAFKYLNYVNYFKQWVKYRTNLEVRMLKYLIERTEREIHVNEVYLFAVRNMEKLLKILPKVLVSKTPDATLAQLLKLPLEDAIIILDRKVRQLAKLEEADLVNKIKGLQKELAEYKRDLKKPGERAARDTDERVSTYLRSPDNLKSGLLFKEK